MSYRKLGRSADQRKAMLRGLVTALLQNGSVVTTETRAKEIQSIAERLIGSAVKEADNFTTKEVKVSRAKKDSKGNKILKEVTGKNGKKYKVVEREITTDLVRVDNPSRLAARRNASAYIYKVADADGNSVNVVSKLFDELATKYKGRKGGFTRIYKTGCRRGDAAPMAIIELV